MQGMILLRQYRQPEIEAGAVSVREAPENTFISLQGLPTKGSDQAKVALVEFTDYECPFCERHAKGVGQEVQKIFVDTKQVRHSLVNNPLPIHANARLLAAGAICAGKQDRFWQMHESLFLRKPRTRDELVVTAEASVQHLTHFRDCIDRPAPTEIERDLQLAKTLNLLSTPSFAVGRIESGGRVRVQKFIIGAVSIDVFKNVIEEVL